MTQGLYFYNTVTEQVKENAGFILSEPTCTFFNAGQEMELDASGGSTVRLSFADFDWDPDRDGLRIRQKVFFEYPDNLYGKEGLVPRDGEFGVCLLWSCGKVDMSGCVLPSKTIESPEGFEYEFDCSFDPEQIAESLIIDYIAYVKKEAKVVLKDESGLANTQGMKLGSLSRIYYAFSSDVVPFPLFYRNDPARPLWWLELEWDDPRIDAFSGENVRLYLNLSNGLCPIKGDKIENRAQMVEIMASVYFLMLTRIDEVDKCLEETIAGGDEIKQGSVAMFLHYFITNCFEPEFRMSSKEDEYASILTNIQRIMG